MQSNTQNSAADWAALGSRVLLAALFLWSGTPSSCSWTANVGYMKA
jgi:uncharacterized membrane protein YphA (DoxX/SURF4 family)